jgi:CelD/BcsL family acetyltransferase involved in cellulose biosynthesis
MAGPDIFAGEAPAFYRDLALLPDENPSRLKIGYLSLDGEVLATFSGTVGHGRVGVMLSSLTESDAKRQSPGALLLRHQIEEACEAGLQFFDLGVGQARHKDEWSNTVCALFDSFIAFKAQGLVLTLPRAVGAQLKRAIKSNRYAWGLAQAVRKRLNSRAE